MAATKGSLAGAIREESVSFEIFFMFGLEVFQIQIKLQRKL